MFQVLKNVSRLIGDVRSKLGHSEETEKKECDTDVPSNKSGLLAKGEIARYRLIVDMKEESLQAGSYDLRVGNMHYVFEDAGHWKPIFLGGPQNLAEINRDIPSISSLVMQLPVQDYEYLVIPPFGSAIIQLEEIVDLLNVATDKNLMISGRFDLKLGTIYKGLISQQATQVEPCYKGRLYCFVHNLGSHAVKIKKGDKFATIEFFYVGQGLRDDERRKTINDTINANKTKYDSNGELGMFTLDGTGIKDIRWFSGKRLPEECGIAPIYNLVQGNIKDEVDKYLEKSATTDKLTNQVAARISERQNFLKIVLSLIAAVITFFTTNLLLEVNAELEYFRQELSFVMEKDSTIEGASLEAIKEHTKELAEVRRTMWISSIILIFITVVLFVWVFDSHMRPSEEQEWEHRKKALQAKQEYNEYKENLENNKKAKREKDAV